jgi:hypothetical protein
VIVRRLDHRVAESLQSVPGLQRHCEPCVPQLFPVS